MCAPDPTLEEIAALRSALDDLYWISDALFDIVNDLGAFPPASEDDDLFQEARRAMREARSLMT